MYCIAGKNQCSIDALSYLISRNDIDKDNLSVCINADDKGNDNWQPSLMKYANDNKISIMSLNDLYKIKNLYFFSLEFDKIIKTKNFLSTNLFNFHFSLLPKYRGCHTNYLQIKNGETISGVTCHEIDDGIDTGRIIDQLIYKIDINDTSKDNYFKLMSSASKLFINLFDQIISGNYSTTEQKNSDATYFSRKSINYKDEKINTDEDLIVIHNQIRSLIFPPYQIPIIKNKEIIKSKLFDDHLILTDIENKEHIYD